MRLKERILCLAIAVSFIGGIPPTFADTVNPADKLEIALPAQLGIIENAQEFFETEEISRGEFSMIAARMLCYDSAGAGDITMDFSDVGEDAPCAWAVSVLEKLGYIRGQGNDMFEPERSITYAEAIKILVSILGYDMLATESGGYPAGYINQAQKLKLLSGIDVQTNMPLHRDALVTLVYRALNTDICRPTQFGNTIRYEVQSGVNLLTECFDLEKREGVVTATAVTALDTAQSRLADNQVRIDNAVYEVQQDFADYLGCYIRFYCRTVNSQPYPFVVFVEEDFTYNEILTIPARDVLEFQAAANVLRYCNEKGKVISKTLPKQLDVIYNGQAYPAYGAAEFMPNEGEIRLIDSNRDGAYETAVIWSYEIWVVDRISHENGLVYGKNRDDALTMDFYDSSTVIDMQKMGARVGLSDLEEHDVVFAAQSKGDGKNYIKATVFTRRVQGDIESISNKSVSLGGEVYPFSKYFTEYRDSAPEYELKAGMRVTVMFNTDGEVIYIDTEAEAGKNYAILLDIASEGTVDIRVKARVLQKQGEAVYYFSDTVTCNDERIQAVRLAKENILRYDYAYTDSADNTEKTVQTVRQIVNIEINGAEEITEINTYENFSRDIAQGFFRENGMVIGKNCRVTENTPVIVFPKNEKILASDVKDSFSFATFSLLQSDITYEYAGYDLDSVNICGVLVIFDKGGSGSRTIPDRNYLTILTSVSKAIDDEGTEYQLLHGMYQGAPVTKAVYPEKVLFKNQVGIELPAYTLKPGDVIAYGTNYTGDINIIQIVLEGAKGKAQEPYLFFDHTSRYDVAFVNFTGTVKNFKNGKDFVFASTEELSLIAGSATSYYIYYADRDICVKAEAADVSIGDFVLVHHRYCNMMDVVIIR